jgi:polar amino acid transport system substrate-binding protein
MGRILLLAIVLLINSMTAGAWGQSAVNSEIAPTGKLRVAVNSQTPVLLRQTSDGKAIGGLALELGRFIAEKLGVPVEMVAYADSRAHTQSFGKGEWDISFGPQPPASADKADFIVDVALSDYMFVAAPGREFANATQVDRPGVKVGVGTDSSSDRFLSRTLKSAELVRLLRVGGIEALRTGQADVWAASASNVQQVADRLPGAKIVPGAFTSDRYMIALPKGRSSEARAKIAEIVQEAKKTGVVRKAVEQTGMKGVRAAPE